MGGGSPPLSFSAVFSGMNKRERVMAALAGQPVDQAPVSFWGHDFLREWSAQGLADAMLESFRRYDWDYMKVNPRATYYAEAWGCRYRPSGNATRGPETVDFVLKSAEDLEKIRPVDIGQGPFAEQLEALRLIGRGLAGEAPFIQTVFSPLAVVGRMANGDLEAIRRYMQEAPQALHSALSAVADTLASYGRACLEAGAGGIFFATVEWGTYDNATAEQYLEFGRPYDLRVLEAVQGAEMNVLHVCRPRNMFDLLADYPVHAINWAVGEPGNHSLSEALARSTRAVMGGVSVATAAKGTPDEVASEVSHALSETGGRRFLLAPGCSIPPETPQANLQAARNALKTWSRARQSAGSQASQEKP
jgi:uroporphyrinogen decarboxylase